MVCRVTYFEGRLFVWKETSGIFLIKKYVTNESCHTFEDEGVISIPNTRKENTRCVAQIAGKTLQALYVVVESISEHFGFVVGLYNVVREKNEWSIHDVGCFEIEESVIERIQLTQDLVLVWNHHDSLSSFWFGTELKVMKRVPLTERTINEILLLREVYADVDELNASICKSVLLIVAKTLASEKENTIVFYVLVVDSLNGYDIQLLRLPSDYFILRFYRSIISAINVVSINICSGLTASDLIKDVEKLNWSKNSTMVCTEKRQFIVFVNGCIRYLCAIPFPDVHQIISFKVHSPLRTLYILQSLKGACAVEKHDSSGQLQVCKSWEDSIAVIVGDFMNSGVSQLLFISHLDPDLMLETCILTDTAINFCPRTSSVLSTSQNKDAMKGMKKALLAGQIAFSEARRKQKEMQTVIDHTAHILESALSKNELQEKFYDSNLIDIVHAAKGRPLPLNTVTKEKPTAAVNIVAAWKTVLQDNWILGWSLRNEFDLILSDFHVHLGTQKETMEYKYKTYRHLTSDPNCQPQPNLYFDEENNEGLKKGELLSVVVSFSLPPFTCDKFEVICTITWKSSAIANEDKRFKQQLSSRCQLSVLNALEKRQDNFKELSVVQQLVSLRVLQDKLSLHFKSEHTDLTQLEKMLTLKLEHYPYTLSHLSSKINIFMDPLSPLYGLNFLINCSSPRQSESVVHYREIKHLLLFLHWLHSSVPEDIIISVENASVRDVKPLLMSSMKEELHFIISFMQQMQNKVADLSQVDESNSNLLKHHFKSEHERILKDSLVLNIEDYVQFRLCLLEKEYENDEKIGQVSL